jgi:putative transposase
MLSEGRDEEAATVFFKQTINSNGLPEKVVIDKSGFNYAGLENINILLLLLLLLLLFSELYLNIIGQILE